MKHLDPQPLDKERAQVNRLPPVLTLSPLSSTEFLCLNIDLKRQAQASGSAPQPQE